jgi:hypothetical protein
MPNHLGSERFKSARGKRLRRKPLSNAAKICRTSLASGGRQPAGGAFVTERTVTTVPASESIGQLGPVFSLPTTGRVVPCDNGAPLSQEDNLKHLLTIAGFMLKVVFFLLGTILGYYLFATLISGVATLAIWDLSILKEFYIFWSKPSSTLYAIARAMLWFIGVCCGVSVIKTDGTKEAPK